MNPDKPDTLVRHLTSLVRLTMRICCPFLALLALFLVIYGTAHAHSCGDRLGDKAVMAPDPALHLENGAGYIKDLYSLPFPRFQYLEARAIAVEDVEAALNSYIAYANAVDAHAHTLLNQEKTLLLELAQFIRKATTDFAKNYSSFLKTSEALPKIIAFNNNIKGHDFETAIAITLIRQGFSNITVGASLRKFVIANMHEKVLHSEDTEVDIFAEKDNEPYLIEIKSLKPTDNIYLEKEIESARKQIEKRDQLLRKIGIRSKMKIIVIQHFNLGEEVRTQWLKAGADHVFFLRKDYLDDFNSYSIE